MKKTNLTAFTFILPLALLLSSLISHANSAPTLLIGKEAVERLQKNVASGEEPFASAWAKVKGSAEEAMSTDMKVYQGVDTVELRFASQKQAGYVRDLMLVYYVEGNVRYRERAVELFAKWATADPMPGKSHVSLSMQDQKVAGSGLEGLGLNFGLASLYWTNAYSLVYPWLSDTVRESSATWFEFMAEEIIRGHLDWTENGYHGNQDYNNHLTGHMLGLLAIGLTLDSQKWIDYALDSEENPRDFYEMYDAAIIMADEDPAEALWRSDPTLTKGAPKPQTGEVYDRYRILTVRDGKGCGLPYAWFHRRMLTLMAEMGHQNGLPLYDYIGKNGENLKDTYVFYADFLIQNDPSIKGGYYANNKLHLNEVYTYELANLRFPDTPEIIEVLQHCDRVQYDHDVFGWSAVLLYGEVIDSVAAAKADAEQATDGDPRIDSPIVVNADFEKGTGWDQRKAHQTFTPDGAVAARSGNAVALAGGWLKRAGEFVYQRTDVPVKAGASYELRAWFAPRSEGQSRYGGAWMRLSAVQPNGSHCVLAHFTSDSAISDWTQYAVAWTAPADLSRVPVLHDSKNEPTGATMDLRGAKLEILVGKYPDRGGSYDQTMIDDVELITTAVVPVTVKPQMDRALQTLELSDGPEKNLDALNVVWETPGRNALDSMPLGNGETALNVWTEADGQIAFYIARGDAWSGIGRLLKLGRMRVRIEPNPFQLPGDFKQTLDLASGTVHVVGSNGFQARIWVDANQSVIRFEAMADQPFTMTAVNDPWRLEDRQLTKEEEHSAWNVMGGPAKFQVVEADTMLPAAGNRIGWYHRNKISIYPEIMQQQDLADHMSDFPDPLINRTFGALAWGDAWVAKDDKTLVTQEPVRQVRLNVTTHTAQTATVEEWVAQAEAQVAAIERRNPVTAFTAHSEWWQAFWERSWIYASGPTPDFLVGDALPKTPRAQIKIGGDWPGGNLFSGKIAQALFYNKVLSNEQVQQIATAGQDASAEALFAPKHQWNFGALTGTKVPDAGFKQVALDVLGEVSTVQTEAGAAVQLSGKGHFLTEKPSGGGGVGDLRFGGALAAWIAPDAMPEGGRIFDFTLPGLDGGYLLEVTKGGTGLRGYYNELVTVAENVLTPGEWTQVALVYDQFHGRLKLFVDGQQVAESDLIDQHRQSDVAAGIYPITQGYALQRFISACAARGEFPIKFNGSLFTMDGKIDYLWTPNTVDADFRKWGPGYWFQNTRLPYWPMLAAGDFDMMEPLWNMYLDTLDRAKLRTKTYFGHEGAYWSETISFFGMNSLNDYGWSRPGLEPGITRNGPIRRYWDGALELSTMMLDRYDMTLDANFLQEKILPIAGAVITFYEQHYDRDTDGKLRFHPSQTVESYVAKDLYNPVTVVAGMRSVIARLLQLPPDLTTNAQRAQWQRVLSELPEIPVADGMLQIAANQQRHFERGNGESPDLYPAFPYHIYGVGRPDLDVARKTFNTLQTWYVGGWNQDSVNAAVLGLPEKAGPLVYRSFLMGSKDAAFPAFWGPNYDWLPDQDHGATAMNALQRMLMQSVDGKILLLPAWPKEWDVNFKLHAAQNTTVEMIVRDGKIEKLDVQPASRKADCVLPDWLGGERKSYDGPSVRAPVNQLKPQ